jgi:predicted amidohydrolase
MAEVRVAIVQESPVHLRLDDCISKLDSIIDKSISNNANLFVFGETWLTGYPAWMDSCPGIALWDNPQVKKAFAELHQSSIEVPGKETDHLIAKAKKHNIVICIGINEKVTKGRASGTIYNSFLIIDRDGIKVHHRKLMPTFSEKLFYGQGDAAGLHSADTSLTRIGGLICWEHWMPLTRQAMHNSGEIIHIALWPTVHEKHQIASRHYAFEGRCYVVAVGQTMKASAIPEYLDIPDEYRSNPDKLILNGGSCVIDPSANFLLEPCFDRDETIYFDLPPLDRAIEERMTLDTSGHYSRPDIFNFTFNSIRL